jgi:hypothetical protein
MYRDLFSIRQASKLRIDPSQYASMSLNRPSKSHRDIRSAPQSSHFMIVNHYASASLYLPSQNAIPTQRPAESKLLKRLPRRLRSPLPINKHTPPLPTSPTIPAHTSLAPILQCLLQDLIIKRTRLQPHTLDTQLLRFLEDFLCDFWGRDD